MPISRTHSNAAHWLVEPEEAENDKPARSADDLRWDAILVSMTAEEWFTARQAVGEERWEEEAERAAQLREDTLRGVGSLVV